ncbi:MAG TPA: 16S rRNA (cytosine(1402)-N(4))-methyltransferase RsmH [Actinomycetota bacterium]|jgi:16S rRNA (cytosine1402-N4)-methyltransferase|nr:16S rRNA (cytosine(1402)-N(4))-methyltransferase RsmH [Actinomycetota bacterium]
MSETPHEAVLVAVVTGFLGSRPGSVVDMTVGAGGHAEALLESGVPRVIGVDRDPEAIALASERLRRFGDRFRALQRRFAEVEEADVQGPVAGFLFDLGVSSMQLDRAERGFGYRIDGPLDMRMAGASEDDTPSAADLVNTLEENRLADLIYRFGEERGSRRIARAIVHARPLRTTDELARVVAGALGRRPGGPHPARRTFQALRIAVNRELEELTASLPQAVDLLAPGGRVVVIAYHSLEDRIVKGAFRDDPRLAVLTKKPVRPTEEEVARNPRARSARLRAAERLEEAA